MFFVGPHLYGICFGCFLFANVTGGSTCFFVAGYNPERHYKCLWLVLILFESIDKVSGTSNDGNATKNIYIYLCIYPFAFICIYSFACCFFYGTLLVDLSRSRILARGTKDMVTINV